MLRWILPGVVCLTISAPAHAAVESWRASGTVNSLQGTPSLLPIAAAVGDDFVIRFSYDGTAADTAPSPDQGSYPILSLAVSIASNQLEWVGPGGGEGHVAIQANTIGQNLWGVSGCLLPCSDPMIDQARLNLFFPPNTIQSDALTGPPDPSGASVQFGLFSRDFPAPEEAFVIAPLDSIVACEPEVCGDGAVGCDEQCDDGNTLAEDGCSATCTCEPEVCGDGVVGCTEQCDDGNTLDGDQCSSQCIPVPEPGQLLLVLVGSLVLGARRRYERRGGAGSRARAREPSRE